MRQRRIRVQDYTVGLVCALPIELAAATKMLNEEHHDLPRDDNDTNLGLRMVWFWSGFWSLPNQNQINLSLPNHTITKSWYWPAMTLTSPWCRLGT
jgi:hypothetical protein